jgi:hypothetical protein
MKVGGYWHTIRTAFGATVQIRGVQTLSSDRSTALLCKDINADAEEGYHIKKKRRRQQQYVIMFTQSSVLKYLV